jgi:NAD(P)-dependent dehydrogenase (short-subunit alcohol dehydrogenase family)
MRDFEGKVALVTGAAGGIGLATAQRLGAEGARVVLADIDAAKLETARNQVLAAGAPEAWASRCDVSREADVQATVAGLRERFGHFDVLVNNAGLMQFAPLESLRPGDWQRILGVDLMGAVHFTREAFLHMARGGAIVNVSSIHAVETSPHVASYAAAKAALLSLTRSTAMEGRDKGLRCNAVLPGAIDTPMLWDNPNVKSGAETIDRAQVGRAEDVAAVIAYLASDDARFVQGAGIRVDGGRLGRL